MAENAENNEGAPIAPMTALLFQEPDMSRAIRSRRARREDARQDDPNQGDSQSVPDREDSDNRSGPSEKDDDEDATRKRRRGKRGGRRNNDDKADGDKKDSDESSDESRDDSSEDNSAAKEEAQTTRRRTRTRQRPRRTDDREEEKGSSTVRRRRRSPSASGDGVTAPRGSTRLEAKKRRRKEGRRASRRRTSISESEYLARREAVDRTMLVREQDGLNQIAVLEDGVLVEHYVARHTQTSMVGNVYLGRVQNVLPSMEAAFVDIGKGRNAVLYAGEVNWDAVGMNGKPRKIEDALKSGDSVLVQVTKDPIGHKGARLTGQVTLAGRHLVLVPNGSMTGISRKLPDKERARLKSILKKVVPSEHGVIVRTAAEGATEEQLQGDVDRLVKAWKDISAKSKSTKNAPSILKSEPELAVRVVRDIFNEDFKELKVSGDDAWSTINDYVKELSPELVDRLEHWTSDEDIFEASRVDEQLAKAFDRKVFLPSGGSLIIERTEAMTVIDVNTGKFTGSGGTLEETVTRNNLEAAEEVVRQLRLRDIGGIIVIDFIDMVLEENRDLVLRRLIECLGRDRTRHQVAEVTSLGLVQMTRKRVGQGLVEAFSTPCECCEGHGYITHANPVERGETTEQNPRTNTRRQSAKSEQSQQTQQKQEELDPKQEEVRAALANIAAAASSKHEASQPEGESDDKKAGSSGHKRQEPKESRSAQSGSRRSDSKKSDQQADAKQVGRGQPDSKQTESKESGQNTSTPRKSDSQRASSRRRGSKPSASLDDPKKDSRASVQEKTGRRGEPKGQQDAKQAEDKPRRQRRRVTSSGTITTSSSPTSHIMTFPAKKSENSSEAGSED